MSIEGKKRQGPEQIQVVLYLDREELEEFDSYIPKGHRSKVFRKLIAAFNRQKQMMQNEDM